MSKPRIVDGRTLRRALSVIASLVVAAQLLAACGGEDDPSSTSESNAASAQEGPWTFTDGRGEKVSLDSPPQKIIAYETAGAALWHLGIEPTAIFGNSPLDKSVLLEGVDVTGIESVGEVYGEINLEKVAALDPDLIVTVFSTVGEDSDEAPLPYGFADTEQIKKMEAFAPVVALDASALPTEVIKRFEEFAATLGADLDSPEVTADRERFDKAVADLKAANEENPGVSILALGAYGDELYLNKPKGYPDLLQYREWGLDMVEPTGSKNFFWEIVSYERADKYPSDLILHDIRPGTLTLDDLAKKPTWSSLPVVEADQLVRWRGQESWNYELFAEDVELLAEGVRTANPDVVP